MCAESSPWNAEPANSQHSQCEIILWRIGGQRFDLDMDECSAHRPGILSSATKRSPRSRWGVGVGTYVWARARSLNRRFSERAVMGLMGWSNPAMAARYQHLTAPIRHDITGRVGGLLWSANTLDDSQPHH